MKELKIGNIEFSNRTRQNGNFFLRCTGSQFGWRKRRGASFSYCTVLTMPCSCRECCLPWGKKPTWAISHQENSLGQGIIYSSPIAALLSQSELGPRVFVKHVLPHLICNCLNRSLIKGTQTLYFKTLWPLVKWVINILHNLDLTCKIFDKSEH